MNGNTALHIKRPTIRDVAAAAQVSHQTVSRVINGDARVAVTTRAKVESAIAQLGYRPNAIARSMARGRTHILACLSPNLTDYTFASIIEAAEVEARQHGYFMLTTSAPTASAFAALVDDLLAHGRVDGLLVINPYVDERWHYLPENIPLVFIGAHPRPEHARIGSVRLDDELAGRQATEHLIERGHTRIGMVTGPLTEECTQDRIRGYEHALQAHGLPVDPALQVVGDWTSPAGYAAFKRLSQQANPPTAIFAQNDRMAVGVMRAAHELGWRVPTQLAVIGVDDMPLAAYFAPPLTTLRQDMARIGQKAAQQLIGAADAPATPLAHVRLPAELVVRAST